MDRYRITTLVDITQSTPSRNSTNKLELGQQSNFNSLRQTIELRANILNSSASLKESGRLPDYWKGKGHYWIFEFETERGTEFEIDSDPVGLLKRDLNGVPIILDLEDNTNIRLPVFKTLGDDINTVIEKLVN